MATASGKRLTVHDWASAALLAMGEGGLAAVAVESLAARLGATKGSFYWHFPNRDAVIEAALALWEEEHTAAVIALVQQEPDPRRRLRRLISLVLASTAEDTLEVTLLATADHPLVRPVLERVSERRLEYLRQLFREMGFTPAQARDRGLLAFTSYVGHAQVARATPALVPSDDATRRRYVERVVQLLAGE